nr:hypothetical protein [Pedobacter panaciterrae]
MKLRSLSLILFTLALMFGGCKKKESFVNPCDGLMNETPPTKIIVKFVDKETGQNLILNNDIKVSDINIINATTGKPFVNWGIFNEAASSPLNGTLQFSVFHETAGQYPYQIKLAKLATVTLTYTVSKTATDSPCKPVAYPISDIMITDHAFSQFIHEGKSYPNILVLEL